jgi:hypothetical protein
MSKSASRRPLTVGDNVRVAADLRTGTVSNIGRYDVTVKVLVLGKIEHRKFAREALLWQAPVVLAPLDIDALARIMPDALPEPVLAS